MTPNEIARRELTPIATPSDTSTISATHCSSKGITSSITATTPTRTTICSCFKSPTDFEQSPGTKSQVKHHTSNLPGHFRTQGGQTTINQQVRKMAVCITEDSTSLYLE